MDAGLRRAVAEYEGVYNHVYWRYIGRLREKGGAKVKFWMFKELVTYENKTYWCVVIQKAVHETDDHPNPFYVEDVYAEAWEC